MTSFGFFAEMPEEMKKQIQEQHDRRIMAANDWSHEVKAFFGDATKEQLLTLRKLLSLLETAPEMVHYYEGVVTALLEFKHGVCPGCGVNHEAEFLESLNPETPATEPSSVEKFIEVTGTEDIDFDQVAKWEANLNKYHVKPGTGNTVVCKKCGQVYKSLEDRMIKSPDDCPTCQQKSMWG